jgi:hypothetical protein
MKITIEIDDKALRDAVEAQVGATLAKWTGTVLEERATEIIGTKLNRFSVEEFVGRKLYEEVRRAVDNALGSNTATQRTNLTGLVKEAIAARVDKALKAAAGA